MEESPAHDISRVIQIALAPAFLGFLLRVNVSQRVAALFVDAMAMLTLALGRS